MRLIRRAAYLIRQLSAERMPVEKLRRLQLGRLRRLVHESYAYTDAYRCLMQRAGVQPGHIETLDDIRRLPIIGKSSLLEFTEQERTNSRLASGGGLARIATSGSSGEPFEFLVDGAGNDWRKAQYLRPYVSLGRRPWHRVLRLTAVNADDDLRRTVLGVFPEVQIACTTPLARQLEILQDYRPMIVQGYPSALRCLAFELRQRGIETPYVQHLFSDSELLTPDSRDLIEKAFGARVLDIFGAYETDNLAYQCGIGGGYHCAIDSAIVEVCSDGEAVVSGQGNLVVTVLTNLTSPFIRYDLRDVVSHRPGPCSCGRTFPLLDVVAGRCDDLVAVAGGGWQSPLSFLWRFDAFSDLLREYQVRQSAVEDFIVDVVPQRRLQAAEKQAIRDVILADFPRARVSVSAVAGLPRTAADKLRAFVCEVPRAQGQIHGS